MGNECQAAELSNGTVVMLMRSSAAQNRLVSHSYDKGLSWTKPRPVLNETQCEGSVVVLPNDGLVLSTPFADSRTNMTLHMSTDGGNSWTVARSIYPGPSLHCFRDF